MSSDLTKINVVVSDEFTKDVPPNFQIDDNALRIRFKGNGTNFNLELDGIQTFLKHKVNSEVLDLYRIASTVYMVDLQLTRPTRNQSRTINVLMSVSNKSKWDGQKRHLESMLRFLSGDNFNFHFVQGKFPDKEFDFAENESQKAISMFSGGLDSLSGVSWLIKQNIQPVIVSHDSSSKKTTHIQNTLYTELKKIIKDLEIIQIKARSTLRGKELTQKARSFLYLSLGSMIALELGIKKVFLFENGILALNIPISISRVFTNTKTAHPKFLADFNKLIDSLFPSSITIENPFVIRTKGEIVQELDNDEFKPMIKETITCSHAFKLQIQKGVTAKHCGKCIPCILRRASVHHANLWDYDDEYAYNILDEFDNLEYDAKTTLLELLTFQKNLEKDEIDILTEIPEFYIEELDPFEIIKTMRRYGEELKNMIRNKGTTSLTSALSGLLT